jgi:uncharacterized protein YndB with AHSA1/START domain
MIDIIEEINAISRAVGGGRIPAGACRTVTARRAYDADVEDVWDAITDPERLSRWFLPVTGDLRLGGTYQLKGNAGGEILRCEPPKLLKVTWVFGEDATEADVSEVEVRLSPADGGGTALELAHAAVVPPERWTEFGPGAVGVGWDGALLGLGLHLATGGGIEDPQAWESSPEARAFFTGSAQAWRIAHEASGASGAEAAAAAENTRRFYAPDPPDEADPS